MGQFPEISLVISIENQRGTHFLVDTNDLKLYENDQLIAELHVSHQDSKKAPIYTVLVIDKSGSMQGEPLLNAKKGAESFVQMMQQEDQSACIEFDTKAAVVSGFSKDKDRLCQNIYKLQPGSDTALLDGIFMGLMLFRDIKGQMVKTLIVLTDGRENRSKHSLDEVIDLARDQRISIYTIGFGGEIDIEMLTKISIETDGNLYQPINPQEITEIYQNVSKILHSQLIITYTTPFPMDDQWHPLRIEIPYLDSDIIGGKKFYLSAKESRIPSKLLKEIDYAQLNQNSIKTDATNKNIYKESSKTSRLIVILAGILVIFLIVIIIMLIIKRK